MSLSEIPPGLILVFGAILVPFLPCAIRKWYVIALPILAFFQVMVLPEGEHLQRELLAGFGDVTLLRVDRLSRAFAYIFTLNAAVTFVFAFYVKKKTQHVASLVYVGSALGVVFAGDLLTLYIFWELMAVSSAFIILSRGTRRASGAAFRYVMIHLLGGLFLLAGMVVTFQATGSLAFEGFGVGEGAGPWLILVGFLVNVAAPPLASWLPDGYPEASVTGGVVLSAYTTKTAVYTLLRAFEGWDILIWVGCIMTIYGLVYALLENDMRRVLAYSIVNQVGFMVCAAGIGGEMAINGATAHAICHIIYKSLLWMAAGAVLYRVGKSKGTELGGLYRAMPWTMVFCMVGAFTTLSMPLTSGFTSKPMILQAADSAHLFWPWLFLEIASAGAVLHAGIKFPYFVFFNEDRGLRPKEAPRSMLIAMGILAFLCLYFGMRPGLLYEVLPYPVEFSAYKASKVIGQLQLLFFSALAFFVFLKLVQPMRGISLDWDWFYRKGTPLFVGGVGRILNGANALTHGVVVRGFLPRVNRFFREAPAVILCWMLVPVWVASGKTPAQIAAKREVMYVRAQRGVFPVGVTVCLAVLLLAFLFLF
ncbi:MAG: Na(+)/H(+) antiporter subunit D [Verrucomicrobiota bacterium]